jgi:flagellar biosynthesis protein FliP
MACCRRIRFVRPIALLKGFLLTLEQSAPRLCVLVSLLRRVRADARGFTPHPTSAVNDKIQHFLIFFLLTLVFYWVVDTTKRRLLNMTIIFSLAMDIGSEILQSFITVQPKSWQG